MPSTLRLAVDDVHDLVADLQAAGRGLERPITDTLREGAEAIATAAKPLMRTRAEGAWASSSGAKYGHIAEYYDAALTVHAGQASAQATVGTRHPGGPVWEWGGAIAPRAGSGGVTAAAASGHPGEIIHIPRLAPVQRAAEAEEEVVALKLEGAVDRLLKSHDL